MSDFTMDPGSPRAAAAYGFRPGAAADDNARALQTAVDQGGTVFIDTPGIYEISQTITIGDDTTLWFGAGVTIKRALNARGEQDAGYVFINKGAFDRTYNRNIKIIGLKLICNGLQADQGTLIPGLRGHVSFFYIRDLVISDFECLDLPPYGFCIQVCTFDNIVVEHARIEGRKDGVHLGCGAKFVIRHCIFRTFDDPVALNAHDYSSANPELGWIENGLVEDCYDLDDSETTGFFCRILAGSWVDWFEGMQVQQSDTVVSNGRLYRVFMAPDGTRYTSVTAPSHPAGTEILDGIRWVMVQDRILYQCGCRNIHFRDIFLQKKRDVAFCLAFDNDRYSRSYYPGSPAPVQQNLLFENIVVDNDISQLIAARTPFDTMKIINSQLNRSSIRLTALKERGLAYPRANILIQGATFSAEGRHEILRCEPGRKAALTLSGSVADAEDFQAAVSPNVEVRSSDIPLERGSF